MASRPVLGDARPGGKGWICCRAQGSGPTVTGGTGEGEERGLSLSLCSVPAPAPAFCQGQRSFWLISRRDEQGSPPSQPSKTQKFVICFKKEPQQERIPALPAFAVPSEDQWVRQARGHCLVTAHITSGSCQMMACPNHLSSRPRETTQRYLRRSPCEILSLSSGLSGKSWLRDQLVTSILDVLDKLGNEQNKNEGKGSSNPVRW